MKIHDLRKAIWRFNAFIDFALTPIGVNVITDQRFVPNICFSSESRGLYEAPKPWGFVYQMTGLTQLN